jgi:hypothetical protein
VIIGFTGLAESGKDTAAEYMKLSYGFKRLSFAGKLKDSVAALFDIPREKVDEWKTRSRSGLPDVEVIIDILGFHQYSFSWREFLQRYGTEAHRGIFGDDFWVNEAMPFIQNEHFVFNDVRFNNEATAILAGGGYVVKLVRDGTDKGDSHESESGLPDELVSYEIENNGSTSDLYSALDEMMKDIHA